MSPAQKQFLSLRQAPARLKADPTSWRLGLTRGELRIVSSSEIIRWVRNQLPKKDRSAVLSEETRLRHLGNPTQGREKFYLERHVSELERDVRWLHKAILTVRLYRRFSNDGAKHGDPKGEENGDTTTE